MQAIESYEETLETMALWKILALGRRQMEEGNTQPTGNAIQGLRDQNKGR